MSCYFIIKAAVYQFYHRPINFPLLSPMHLVMRVLDHYNFLVNHQAETIWVDHSRSKNIIFYPKPMLSQFAFHYNTFSALHTFNAH